jgi:cytochrome c biogenesis protein CcdA
MSPLPTQLLLLLLMLYDLGLSLVLLLLLLLLARLSEAVLGCMASSLLGSSSSSRHQRRYDCS